MILAGDVGGTHTRIALFQEDQGKLHMTLEKIYPSREHASLHEIVTLFMAGRSRIDAACFGVAGPVMEGKVSTPNLAWVVNAVRLSHDIGVQAVWLINDLEAHAAGIEELEEVDFVPLNAAPARNGNAGLIAAGTGLGQAGLYWDGVRRHVFPCEGGHCDFAPRNDLEIELHRYLLKKFGRVSYERVLSGQGIRNIYEFLRESGTEPEPKWLKDELEQAADPAAVISHHGMGEKASICSHTLDIFVSVYGAEAGNLALKLLATGGIFISGGIAAKILSRLLQPAFLQAFVSKGRLQPLMESIPVKVVNSDQVGLLGAARYAAEHSRESTSQFQS